MLHSIGIMPLYSECFQIFGKFLILINSAWSTCCIFYLRKFTASSIDNDEKSMLFLVQSVRQKNISRGLTHKQSAIGYDDIEIFSIAWVRLNFDSSYMVTPPTHILVNQFPTSNRGKWLRLLASTYPNLPKIGRMIPQTWWCYPLNWTTAVDKFFVGAVDNGSISQDVDWSLINTTNQKPLQILHCLYHHLHLGFFLRDIKMIHC